MDGGKLFIIEMILLHGAVLVFAVYELWSVQKLRKQRRARNARDAQAGSDPGAARHAEGQKHADPAAGKSLER